MPDKRGGEKDPSAIKEKRDIPKLKSGVFSMPSETHPGHNEDRGYASDGDKLYAVFDGIGGEKGGEAAAKIAAEYLQHHGAAMFSNLANPKEARNLADILFTEINGRIMSASAGNNDLTDMGTTGSLLKFFTDQNGNRFAVIANVGDSRIYRRPAGQQELEQLSVDHLSSATKKALKTLSPQERERVLSALDNASSLRDLTTLTPKEIEAFSVAFKYRNWLGAALDGKETDSNIGIFAVNPGDEFLLTTDGIHDNTAKNALGQRLLEQAHLSADESAKQIVQKSRIDSHTVPDNSLPDDLPTETEECLPVDFTRQKADDMTAIVVRVPEK